VFRQCLARLDERSPGDGVPRHSHVQVCQRLRRRKPAVRGILAHRTPGGWIEELSSTLVGCTASLRPRKEDAEETNHDDKKTELWSKCHQPITMRRWQLCAPFRSFTTPVGVLESCLSSLMVTGAQADLLKWPVRSNAGSRANRRSSRCGAGCRGAMTGGMVSGIVYAIATACSGRMRRQVIGRTERSTIASSAGAG